MRCTSLRSRIIVQSSSPIDASLNSFSRDGMTAKTDRLSRLCQEFPMPAQLTNISSQFDHANAGRRTRVFYCVDPNLNLPNLTLFIKRRQPISSSRAKRPVRLARMGHALKSLICAVFLCPQHAITLRSLIKVLARVIVTKEVVTQQLTKSTALQLRCAIIASTMPIPKPGAKPTNVHDRSVPIMTVHSLHRRAFAEVKTASVMSSIPRKRTSVDANIVGTNGRMCDETKNRTIVRPRTMAVAGRSPPALMKNSEFGKT